MSNKPSFIYSDNLRSLFARTLRDNLVQRMQRRILITSKWKPRYLFVVTSLTAVKDKIEQLTAFKENGVSCPAFTTDNPTALPGDMFFARTVVNGTQGAGIVKFHRDDPVPPAPLYVQYVPKSKEFRVHVFNGEVIDIQEKRKSRNFPDPENRDKHIRNHRNGYVYCRNNVTVIASLDSLAIKAVASLGYMYGAVDIIWSAKNGLFVLEVNSKPGLEGTTLTKYVDAIIKRNE